MTRATLQETIARRAVVLDGGLATLLERHGHDLSSDLWSARLLRDDPAAIERAHREFFAAGAEVATTASYQVSFEGFGADGVEREEVERLLRRSVALAAAARDEVAPDGWVAASVGPYGAVLADGSEYVGRYGLSAARLREFHLPRIELLASAGPDLLAVETIPDAEEAEVLVGILEEVGLPAWLSYSVSGAGTRAGQPLAEAFAVATSSQTLVAVGVNCCAPDDVLPALQVALQITGLPGVAYPNTGQGWDSDTHTWSGTASYDVSLAPSWVDAGARFVGGCCEVGPADISALADVLR